MSAKFNNTPGLINLRPESSPKLEGRALLLKIEDDYSEFRSAVNLGLCKDSSEVHAKFKADIAKAGGAL